VAVAIRQAAQQGASEPTRTICPHCLRPVLVAIVGGETIIAELYEWQPRSRCFPCAGAQATSKNGKVHCSRCGGSGFIGSRRPKEPMLAIDVAWSDEGHLRVIAPSTPRRRGEALHALHRCEGLHGPIAAL
jgi:hypothetical protein